MLGWSNMRDMRWWSSVAFRLSPGDRHTAFRLGRSLAFPASGFVRINGKTRHARRAVTVKR